MTAAFKRLEFIDGVGAITAQKLAKLVGGDAIIRLLFHTPVAIKRRVPINSEDDLSKVNFYNFPILTGQVTKVFFNRKRFSKAPSQISFLTSFGLEITIAYFNYGDYLSRIYTEGKQLCISGKLLKSKKDGWQMFHPDYALPLAKQNTIKLLEPVYGLTEKISNKMLGKYIADSLNKFSSSKPPEWLSEQVISKHNLPSFLQALDRLHIPQKLNDIEPESSFYKRLAFDEIFANQLAIRISNLGRYSKTKYTAQSFDLVKQVVASLPFKLTPDQEQTCKTILQELKEAKQINRLIQGDVGSGKTVVAQLSCIAMAENGHQATMMVPTTILAEQIYNSFVQIAGSLLKIELLTSQDKGKIKEDKLTRLANGDIDILVGTHSLIQDNVQYKNLGLVVVDEQHRFGVKQRVKLLDQNPETHFLMMTATPIPRSLAIAYFTSMDMSIIKTKPSNRKVVETSIVSKARKNDVVAGLQRALQKGEKVYWVCPLLEESENEDPDAEVKLSNVKDRYKEFSKIFGKQNIDIVHGKMKEAEKIAALKNFKHGEAKVLVSTTVVEVGVDVPDATIIVIENAERFGLSQLHQLRGRVGRGDKQSFCILLYEASSINNETTAQRLQVLRNNFDGFKIAEEDLKLRGFGQLAGERQSGVASFKFFDLNYHQDILQDAAELAENIVKNKEHTKPEFGLLQQYFDVSLM